MSILQSIVWIGYKCGHGGDLYIRPGCCQQNICHYFPKKIILQSAILLHSWPRQVLNHVFILLRTLLKDLDMDFHIVQMKPRLMEKSIPLLLLVARVCQVEYIPYTIPDHVIMGFIIAWIYGNLSYLVHVSHVLLFYLMLHKHNWLLWIGPCGLLKSYLYRSLGKIQSQSFLGHVNQFILTSGYIYDQGTIYPPYFLYILPH